jgi:hypothetical protein
VFSFGAGYLEPDWNRSDFWNWNWNFFFEDPELDSKFLFFLELELFG